jgi:tripartite-type tricarboxylate transporter receptor subunit TctC
MNPAVLEVIGGQVHGIISTTPPALAHVRNGRLRALGVASLKRTRALPDVPTLDESGFPGFEAAAWNAVLAPKGTPYDVVTRLNLAIVGIARTQPFRRRLATLGGEVIADTPDEFTVYLRAEIAKWDRVVRMAGVRIQ